MRNLFLFPYFIAIIIGCTRENAIDSFVPLSCGHDSTLLNLQVKDFYTDQPVQYSTKITELEGKCVWCLQPQVIADLFSDSLGNIGFKFLHNPDPKMYYRTSIIPEQRYKFSRLFDLEIGCEMNYEIKMKPTIDLCILIRNVSNKPMPIKGININTFLKNKLAFQFAMT